MWNPRRSAGFHLVSPSSLLVPGPLSSFVCRGVGGTEPGIEILLLTLKGRKSSWGACKCLSVFFMGGGLCGSCAQAERLGICCCFYGTADSHRAPPRHLLGRLRVCARLRARALWGGRGEREKSSGGGEAFPLLPRTGLCFTISSLRGWYPWKRIWISSQFRAGERETRGWVGGWVSGARANSISRNYSR